MLGQQISCNASPLPSLSEQESQQQTQQIARADSEWRKELEQLAAKDGPSASVAAYEMVSFLGGSKYGDQAFAIVPSQLTKLDNPLTFDVILFDRTSAGVSYS